MAKHFIKPNILLRAAVLKLYLSKGFPLHVIKINTLENAVKI
jgi:hypothetical protein